jgi:hypothetical protein
LNFQARPDFCAYFNAPTLGCDRDPITYKLTRIPHPLENPDIKFDAVQDLFDTTPWNEFRQEILAEFTDNFGSVFGDVASVVQFGTVGPLEYIAGADYIAGVDLARINDYTVISVFRTDGKQMAIYRFNGLSWATQIERIISVAETYKCNLVLDRSNIGDAIVEQLRNELGNHRLAITVDEVYLTPQNKKSIIDGLIVAIEKKAIALLDDKEQYAELTSYEYNETPTKLIRTSAPKGRNDDIVIANALAVSKIGFSVPSHSNDVVFDDRSAVTTKSEYLQYTR